MLVYAKSDLCRIQYVTQSAINILRAEKHGIKMSIKP